MYFVDNAIIMSIVTATLSTEAEMRLVTFTEWIVSYIKKLRGF
jgi:hypothetical protein